MSSADSAAKPPVLVLGGGFAGLAAAVELADRGLNPILLERRAFLGGRAYSFTDKTTGDTVDNGQHLMMGCYHHTLRFLEKIGSLHKLKFQPSPQVDFLNEGDGRKISHATFKCPSLPAPLHLLAGLAKLKTLGWRDRIQALRVGMELRKLNGGQSKRRDELSGITVREWLNRLGQTEQMQQRFWDLVAVATLNETPDRASADMFARVLDQAFMHTRQDSTMVISKTGLSELYTDDARIFIEARGGQVRLSADVVRINFDGGKASGVTLRSGEVIEVGTIISALPYFALRRIIPEEVLAGSASLRCLQEFNSTPIVSVNLWYADPVTKLEFTGLLNSRIEWVFNKNAIAGNAKSRPQHLALVVSAAHESARMPKEDLIAIAVAEMKRFFPLARTQEPIHAFVVREQDATISHTVGVAKLRPSYRTEFENFFLAGDWTDTGLPATIESAVQSGHECARLIFR